MRSSIAPTPKGITLLAFSLLELIGTLAIILILMACVTPMVGSALKASQLTHAGQLVFDQLAYARQRTLSRNHSVEVRFYQSTANNITRFGALQLFDITDNGTALPLTKVLELPNSVLIDENPTLSSLLKTSQAITPPVLIPQLGSNYACRAFRFLPDGSTNLSPATDLWFVTLHATDQGDKLTNPPKNFFNLQIDPSNGQLRTFRP